MDKIKRAVVVPTVRPTMLKTFMSSWGWEDWMRSDDVLIIVCDAPQPFSYIEDDRFHQYGWEDIDKDLGAFSWIIPRRTDAIRSYGFLKAVQLGADIIITLDDDCHPTGGGAPNFLYDHELQLTTTRARTPAWQSTLMGLKPRGMPYEMRERVLPVGVNVGLWNGFPDLDALTQLNNERYNMSWDRLEGDVPLGTYIPMCGMNLSFAREMSYAMYFLLMGQDYKGNKYPYDRFADIWCGVIAKKVMDRNRIAMKFGHPHVAHSRASNVWTNLEKEWRGLRVHEHLWQYIDSKMIVSRTIRNSYMEMADWVYEFNHDLADEEIAYWRRLGSGMKIWAQLIDEAI